MKKRIFALVLALGLAVTTAAAELDGGSTGEPVVTTDTPATTALAAPSSGDIPYMAWDDANKMLTPATIAESECSEFPTPTTGKDYADWNAGWYVVKENMTIDYMMQVRGDVKLILCDGAKLEVTATSRFDSGININGTSAASLTIYGQSGQTGELTSTATDNAHEGIHVATNGSLIINGGNVTATGNAAKSIGSGIECGHPTTTMTVNSGTLIAKGTGAAGCAIVVVGPLTLPTTYWWRTAADGAYTESADKAYTPGSEAYAEITTTEPVQPAPEPEPIQPVQPIRPSGNKDTTTVTTETVSAPKTADPGVLLTATLSVASLLGMGYVGKKR